jgi:hypothetical protein
MVKRQFTIYDGHMILTLEENQEKKEALWDKFIQWCVDHQASSGEDIQSDNFVLDAPSFMAEALDEIVQFELNWQI